MKLKAVLFDLDGTLLDMDQDAFIKEYMTRLVGYLSERGYRGDGVIRALSAGIRAMLKNDGRSTGEEAFFSAFRAAYGEGGEISPELLTDFYTNEFDKIRSTCGTVPYAEEAVRRAKRNGLLTVLATNPLFPRAATEARCRWAGLSPSDFQHITTYECTHFTKPSLDYYREILDKMGLSGDECVMVGNDVDEDMIAEELGLSVYLVTNDIFNRSGKDIDGYERGDLAELCRYLDSRRGEKE